MDQHTSPQEAGPANETQKPATPDREVHKAVIQTVIILAILGVLAWVLYLFFKPALESFGKAVASTLGLGGAFIFVYIVDMFIMPVTADVLFTSVGAWEPVPFILTISVASIAGGSTGFWLSRMLSHLPFIQVLVNKYRAKGTTLLDKYGIWAVVLAALTPIPYSGITWLCGTLGMKFSTYLLGSLFRFPRMALYWAVIQAGIHLAG